MRRGGRAREDGEGEDGRRTKLLCTSIARGDPNVSPRGPTLFFLLPRPLPLLPYLHAAFHRKGEDDKEAGGETEGERGRAQGWKTRKSNSNLLALRYRELARLRVISAILGAES